MVVVVGNASGSDLDMWLCHWLIVDSGEVMALWKNVYVRCLKFCTYGVGHGTDLSVMKLKYFLGTGVEYGTFGLDFSSWTCLEHSQGEKTQKAIREASNIVMGYGLWFFREKGKVRVHGAIRVAPWRRKD